MQGVLKRTQQLGLSALLILLIAATAVIATPSAHAQTQTITQGQLTEANGWSCTGSQQHPRCTRADGSTASCDYTPIPEQAVGEWACSANYADGGSSVTSGSGSNTVTTNPDGTQTSSNSGAEMVNAGGGAVANAGLGLLLSPLAVLMWVIFKITSLLLGLAGVVFNWTVAILVFQFATHLGNSPGMLVAWGILRDFGNIGLLFGFVFMGISTILDLHSYPWKKALPSLVIFAVLLNFSLFAAEAIVDSANVLAATLYDQTSAGQQGSGSDWLGYALNTGIAGPLLERLNIASVYGGSLESTGDLGGTISGAAVQFTDPLGNILKFTAFALVTSIAAVVLFAGAFMLLSRAVVLAFLMVTSPIGFAGMAIPPLNKLAQDWWHKLLDQALFAPVFLLLLLVALKMTDGLTQLASTGGLAAALIPTQVGESGSLLLFGLIIGFMVGALMLAKQFGIYGASFAVNAASGFVYGTTTRATNAIFGGAATRLRDIQQNRKNRGQLGGGPMARNAIKYFVNPVAKSNLDLRRMPGVGGILGAAGIKEGAKPAEHATFKDLQHQYDDVKRGKLNKDLNQEYASQAKLLKLEDEAHDDFAGGATMSKESVDYLNDLSEAQLLQLHGIKSAVRGMAAKLKPEKFDSLMKSDKLDDTTKEELQAARKEYFTDARNITNATTTIQQMKPEVFVKLPNSIKTHANVLQATNARQIAHLDPNDLDPAELTQVVTHLRTEKAAGPAGSAKWQDFEALMRLNRNVANKWRAHAP